MQPYLQLLYFAVKVQWGVLMTVFFAHSMLNHLKYDVSFISLIVDKLVVVF